MHSYPRLWEIKFPVTEYNICAVFDGSLVLITEVQIAPSRNPDANVTDVGASPWTHLRFVTLVARGWSRTTRLQSDLTAPFLIERYRSNRCNKHPLYEQEMHTYEGHRTRVHLLQWRAMRVDRLPALLPRFSWLVKPSQQRDRFQETLFLNSTVSECRWYYDVQLRYK